MKYILITISILFLSCRNSESNRIDNIIRYNETSNITSLDPIYSNTQANIWATSQIFNTFVELDEHAEIQPSLAKSWIISECGTTYKFFLRDDVFYHSSDCFGNDSTRKVSAYDFLFSISSSFLPAMTPHSSPPPSNSTGKYTLHTFIINLTFLRHLKASGTKIV